jgi:glycosyltransferase involved in cell wall biosynthesis
MPITVGFDATSAVRQTAGIGRYTRQLLAALAQLDDDTRYRLFYWGRGECNGSLPQLDRRFRVRKLPISDRVANAVWHRARAPLPVQLVVGAFDLYHSPDFTLPPVFGRPAVLTVHDLAFLRTPECAFPSLRAYLQEVVPRSVERATHVVAVSESTRRDCIELLGTPPAKVTTILEGVGPAFHPSVDPEADRVRLREAGIAGSYILTAATLEPRKNYVRLLEAFALLRARGVTHRLVIAGQPGWMFEPIFEAVRRLKLVDAVKFLRPDDRLLAALYGRADVFVFPSLYEGFGIPPLEALACGAPVACSDTSSLPEVVGDAAVLFDPLDVEAIAAGVMRLLDDRGFAQRLRILGLDRAATFTWERAAIRTHDLYLETLSA